MSPPLLRLIVVSAAGLAAGTKFFLGGAGQSCDAACAASNYHACDPAVQASSERTRRYAIGSWEVLLQQTGRYAVDVRAKSDDGAMEHITTLRTLSWQAIPTASRPWDYDDQWDPVMLEGEPACCAMDLASGRGPAVTGAWSYRGGLRLTVETPALGPNESASCTLVMLTPQGSAPADMTCEDFRALTSGAKP